MHGSAVYDFLRVYRRECCLAKFNNYIELYVSENDGVWMIVNYNAEFNRKDIVAVKLNQARIR